MSVATISGGDPNRLTPSPEVLSPSLPQSTSIFNRSTQFFIDLLKMGGNASLNGAVYITLIAMDACFAIQTIFYRLIFSPPFNPLNPAFKEVTLKNFENRVPELNQKLILLNLKFSNLTSYEQDLKDLEQILNEVHHIYFKLQHYHSILINRKNFKALENDVKKVLDLYKDLDRELLDFLNQNSFKILELFKAQLVLLTHKGMDLPSNWRDDINSRWNHLVTSFENYIARLPSPINHEFENLLRMMERINEGEKHPLRLRNYANSCYLASAFQVFACHDSFRNEIKNPIPFDPANSGDYLKKVAIQNELLKFTDVQISSKKGSSIDLQFFFSLIDSAPIEGLRRAIFESKLHPSLNDITQLHFQHDAAYVAEFFIDQFFTKNKFKLEITKTSPEFPGLAFKTQTPAEALMQVGLLQSNEIKQSRVEGEDDEEREKRIRNEIEDKSQIGDLIHKFMEESFDDPNNAIKFNPQKDKYIVTDPDEGEKSKKKPKCRVAKYHRSSKIINPPEVLALQFKRFGYDVKTQSYSKKEEPVVLPQDGVVDLTPYASETARYKITSYVVHRGGYAGGHYTCYVSMDGKYYYCDDMKSEYYQEISEKEFYSCDQAYLVTLKKI